MAELFFGEYRLDTKTLTLAGPEGPVECRAMALQLLLFLIERRNRFVSREELIDNLWPASAKGASSLNQCISELRRSLRDKARKPNYIETRVKLGYRFIAPIFHKPTERLEPLPPPPEVETGHSTSSPWRRWPILLLVLGLAAAVGVAGVLVHSKGRRSPAVTLAAPIGEDGPLANSLAEAVHEAVLLELAQIDRLNLVGWLEASDLPGTAVLEIRCRSVHEVRTELTVVLRQSAQGGRLWGWTWVLPANMPDLSESVAEIAAVIAAETADVLLR